MSTLPVAKKKSGFWPGDRVTVGLPGEKGTGVRKNHDGGMEYEVLSREYKDEWGNTIVILRSIAETEEEGDTQTFSNDTSLGIESESSSSRPSSRRHSVVSTILSQVGDVGRDYLNGLNFGKGIYRVDTLSKQIYPLYT